MSRQKILDAAINVFSRAGYHKASMDEIAQEANVAKGTLYYNFSGKAELFKTLVTEGLDMIMQRIKRELDEDSPVELQIRNIIKCNVDVYLEYSELARVFFNEISSGIDDKVLFDINGLRKGYITFIADILKEGAGDGIVREMDFELAASAFIGLVDSTCKYYIQKNELSSSECICDFLMHIVKASFLL